MAMFFYGALSVGAIGILFEAFALWYVWYFSIKKGKKKWIPEAEWQEMCRKRREEFQRRESGL